MIAKQERISAGFLALFSRVPEDFVEFLVESGEEGEEEEERKKGRIPDDLMICCWT